MTTFRSPVIGLVWNWKESSSSSSKRMNQQTLNDARATGPQTGRVELINPQEYLQEHMTHESKQIFKKMKTCGGYGECHAEDCPFGHWHTCGCCGSTYLWWPNGFAPLVSLSVTKWRIYISSYLKYQLSIYQWDISSTPDNLNGVASSICISY